MTKRRLLTSHFKLLTSFTVPATTILTIKDALLRSARWLSEREIESARLDAEVLLADIVGLERLGLYLAWDRPLSADERERYLKALQRRATHEPVAYIVGSKEFHSLRLRVTPDVLVPRPETEILAERAMSLAKEGARVVDVGTGSGAIAIVLAREIDGARVVATDVCERALAVARDNAAAHGVGDAIDFRHASFLDGVDGPVDMVVSNPPYVAERDRATLPPDVRDHEPAGALFAGEDGLDAIRALAPQAAERLCGGGWLALEVGAGQAEQVADLLAADGRFEPAETTRDYQGIDRVVTARRRQG